LGIITATDFVAYLKENLNIDDVNTKILASINEHVIEELERQGELPKDVQKGGQEYEK
jgi:hypothetical protein